MRLIERVLYLILGLLAITLVKAAEYLVFPSLPVQPPTNQACVSKLAAMAKCTLPQDLPQLIELDLTFHQTIINLSDSTKLIDLWSSLNGQIGALMLRGMEQQALAISDVVRLHTIVIDVLSNGTPTQVQQAIVDHYIRDEAENTHYFLEIPQTVDLVTAKIG